MSCRNNYEVHFEAKLAKATGLIFNDLHHSNQTFIYIVLKLSLMQACLQWRSKPNDL